MISGKVSILIVCTARFIGASSIACNPVELLANGESKWCLSDDWNISSMTTIQIAREESNRS